MKRSPPTSKPIPHSKGDDMKKLIWITILLLIVLCAFISCAQEPSDDNMTDSYRTAREAFHEASNIWLPVLSGVESTNDIATNFNPPLVNFTIDDDGTVFAQLVTLFSNSLGRNPDQDEAAFKDWENVQFTRNGQLYDGHLGMTLSNGKLSIMAHLGKVYTISVTAKTGGTAVIKPHWMNETVTSVIANEGLTLDLQATPSSGYEFSGWYDGETSLGTSNPLKNYTVATRNVTIEARFTEGPTVQMTDYYATGRQKLIDWNLITLPEIEGLGSEDFTIDEGIGWWTSDADICFDFDSGVTEDAYNAIKACIEALCGTTQTEGNPRIDYDNENPEQIVQIDNWWAYNGKRYNLCFNIENEGLYLNIIQSN